MTDAAAVRTFIAKWEQNTQKESAAAKEHFSDLCWLLTFNLERAAGQGVVVGAGGEEDSEEE